MSLPSHLDGPPVREPSETVLARLRHLHPKSIDLSLERLERLLNALGHPEELLPPVIHVAGTNGKGSVIAFLKAILEAGGRRVHTYTSPHLVHFHERINLNGAPIGEDMLVDILNACEAANGNAEITYFEITTAAAFLAFSRVSADAALVEVGLGGLFDATNVIRAPAATAITLVDYDHQHFLGDTLTEIAAEKAGILKPGAPAIVAPQTGEARAVIEDAAARVGAPLHLGGQDWTAYEEHGRLVYQDSSGLLDLPLPRLQGRHQIINAGMAVALVRTRAWPGVDARSIEAGLRQVRWPGRLQRLTRGPLVEVLPEGAELWLDGAHNPAGARALAQSMADLEERVSRPLYLVMGIMETKDARGVLTPFRSLARKVITVPLKDQPNGQDPAVLAGAAQAIGLSAETAEGPLEAVERTLRLAESDEPPRILICGSLYLAGEVLAENG